MYDAAVANPKDSPRGSRYERLVKIAAGGMATVYVGKLRGALGVEELVAIKRPHPHLMHSPGLRSSLLAEARLAARMRHTNVVRVRDVEAEGDSLLLVMDYVEGASLYELLHTTLGADPMTTIRVGLRVIRDLCAGLTAVHELTDDENRLLGAVHRDVSPQNVLVGVDGVSRLADFGIAKCLHAHDQSTGEGTLKGKFSYMAPEYMRGAGLDHRADIFAVGVILWELLTLRRLFEGESQVDVIRKVLTNRIPPISEVVPELGAFDAVAERALARDPEKRFDRATELAAALDEIVIDSPYDATPEDVASYVRQQVGERLLDRRRRIKDGIRPPVAAPEATGTMELPAPPAPVPSPPVAFATMTTGPTPSEVRALRPRSTLKVALVSAGTVLVIGLAAIAGSGAFSARAPQVSPSAPLAAESLAPENDVRTAPLPSASSSSSEIAPAAAPILPKTPERVEKPKPKKAAPPPPPPAPRPSGDAKPPAPPAEPSIPRPRGNPY